MRKVLTSLLFLVMLNLSSGNLNACERRTPIRTIAHRIFVPQHVTRTKIVTRSQLIVPANPTILKLQLVPSCPNGQCLLPKVLPKK